jgi:2'-5' RNA ligase
MSGVRRRSGLVVEIPEAEPVVGPHRSRLDVNAQLGVPAHVTVLFPFMPTQQCDVAVLAKLQRLFATTPAFDYRLSRTAWFDQAVLWLAPIDPRPFLALTELVYGAFPAFPPFEGQFDEVVPHLTVAHGYDLSAMKAAEQAVEHHLPISGRARHVTLMSQNDDSGRWTRTATFPLN